jgi:hypothetical protein
MPEKKRPTPWARGNTVETAHHPRNTSDGYITEGSRRSRSDCDTRDTERDIHNVWSGRGNRQRSYLTPTNSLERVDLDEFDDHFSNQGNLLKFHELTAMLRVTGDVPRTLGRIEARMEKKIQSLIDDCLLAPDYLPKNCSL